MGSLASLEKIRPLWTSRLVLRLARAEGVRESFQEQLEAFYAALLRSVDSGDPSWLGPVLDGWTGLQAGPPSDPADLGSIRLLNLLFQTAFEAGRESLPPADALDLIDALLPPLSHCFERQARREADRRVEQITRELELTREEMEQIDKSKSDFIAIAAHELKTPLTLIEGYSGMLRDHLHETDESSHTSVLLKGVRNGCQRLHQIVDDMIDVSMIDNRLLALNFQPVWIDHILEKIEEEVEATVKGRDQTLSIQDFPGSKEMTYGDEERLYQALRNVIGNAIKYTPDGGEVLVDGRELPGFMEIRIKDNGIGIDPRDHARIFEKFGRLGSISKHSSGKSKFKGGGPGLGLSITKGIIEAHGGAIWVESEGHDEVRCPGTIFHILLPVRKEPPDEKMKRIFGPLAQMSPRRQEPVEEE